MLLLPSSCCACIHYLLDLHGGGGSFGQQQPYLVAANQPCQLLWSTLGSRGCCHAAAASVPFGNSPTAADAACCVLQGVCPQIHFYQYIIASTLCTAHHRALSVFFGRSMPSLADLFSGKPVTDVGATVYRFVSPA